MKRKTADQQASVDRAHPLQTLYAAGLNAHAQLISPAGDNDEDNEDVRAFRTITSNDAEDFDIDIVFAGWSTTVLASRTPPRIWSLGHQKLEVVGVFGDSELHPTNVVSGNWFGDHNGLLGCLSPDNGIVMWVTGDSQLTPLPTTAASPTLSHIALAGNGRAAVASTTQTPSEPCSTHILEFADTEAFRAWYADPSAAANAPEAHHTLPGRPVQLVAAAATFLLLMEGGEVYSWGDPRYQSLGRGTGIDGTPAEEPGVIEALGGLRIVKVACGGWLGAALSEDGAVYLWGAASPPGGGEGCIGCLREAGAGEVVLVELPGDSDAGEPLDLVDVAVGDAHVAAVTADGQLFVVGDNRNGQLGLDSRQFFFEDWTIVPALSNMNVRRVVCGPKATFAFAQHTSPRPTRK